MTETGGIEVGKKHRCGKCGMVFEDGKPIGFYCPKCHNMPPVEKEKKSGEKKSDDRWFGGNKIVW